jgi:hypothetical protein
MSCNSIVSCRCNKCKVLVTVTSATVTAGKLILNIPSQNLANNEKICLLIALTLPVSSTPIPVVITVGTSTTQLPLISKCGNFIYSDQIKTRSIYPLSFKSDVKQFDFIGKFCLSCTGFIFPVFTPTAPPAEAATLKMKGDK